MVDPLLGAKPGEGSSSWTQQDGGSCWSKRGSAASWCSGAAMKNKDDKDQQGSCGRPKSFDGGHGWEKRETPWESSTSSLDRNKSSASSWVSKSKWSTPKACLENNTEDADNGGGSWKSKTSSEAGSSLCWDQSKLGGTTNAYECSEGSACGQPSGGSGKGSSWGQPSDGNSKVSACGQPSCGCGKHSSWDQPN